MMGRRRGWVFLAVAVIVAYTILFPLVVSTVYNNDQEYTVLDTDIETEKPYMVKTSYTLLGTEYLVARLVYSDDVNYTVMDTGIDTVYGNIPVEQEKIVIDTDTRQYVLEETTITLRLVDESTGETDTSVYGWVNLTIDGETYTLYVVNGTANTTVVYDSVGEHVLEAVLVTGAGGWNADEMPTYTVYTDTSVLKVYADPRPVKILITLLTYKETGEGVEINVSGYIVDALDNYRLSTGTINIYGESDGERTLLDTFNMTSDVFSWSGVYNASSDKPYLVIEYIATDGIHGNATDKIGVFNVVLGGKALDTYEYIVVPIALLTATLATGVYLYVVKKKEKKQT